MSIPVKRRLEIVREYKAWLSQTSYVDNYGTFLYFLNEKGYLKDARGNDNGL